MKDLIIMAILIFLVFTIAVYTGKNIKKNEITRRANLHYKKCYSNQDLEVIIFGEIQE